MTEHQQRNKELWTIAPDERAGRYDTFLNLLARNHCQRAVAYFEAMPPDPQYVEVMREQRGDCWTDAFYDGGRPYNLHVTKTIGALARIQTRREAHGDSGGLRRAYRLCLIILTDIMKLVSLDAQLKEDAASVSAVFDMEVFCLLAVRYMESPEDRPVVL